MGLSLSFELAGLFLNIREVCKTKLVTVGISSEGGFVQKMKSDMEFDGVPGWPKRH
jgi:hypothetical protein